MRGRKGFTSEEICKIETLLIEKGKADYNGKKRIRNNLRIIGFYITDFDTSRKGFTVDDFHELINSNRIEIVE